MSPLLEKEPMLPFWTVPSLVKLSLMPFQKAQTWAIKQVEEEMFELAASSAGESQRNLLQSTGQNAINSEAAMREFKEQFEKRVKGRE
jgi:hypothetical protein